MVFVETFRTSSIKKSSFRPSSSRTPRINRRTASRRILLPLCLRNIFSTTTTLLIAHTLRNDISVFVSASLFLPYRPRNALVIFNEGKSFRGSPAVHEYGTRGISFVPSPLFFRSHPMVNYSFFLT